MDFCRYGSVPMAMYEIWMNSLPSVLLLIKHDFAFFHSTFCILCHRIHELHHEKTCIRVSDQVRAAQSQKIARSLKFRIKK